MINMNNILLKHNGIRVSIAQHRDEENPMDTQCQEIGVGEPSVDMHIVRYASTLTEFIEALQRVQSRMDIWKYEEQR